MAAIIKTDQLWLDQTTSSTVGAPALIFGADSLSGLYRIGTNNIGLTINGTKLLDLSSATFAVTGAGTFSTTLGVTGVSSFGAGAVGAPSIYLSTDTTTGLYRIGTNNVGFAVSGAKLLDLSSSGLTVRVATNNTLVVDSSNVQVNGTLGVTGNVGIGATLSAWGSSYKVLQFNTVGNLAADTTTTLLTSNAYYNAGWIYATTSFASNYYQYQGTHHWATAASGTAGNPITFTEPMILDASGNLLLGTTSVFSGGSSGQIVSSYDGSVENGFKSSDTNAVAGTDTAFAFQRNSVQVGTIQTTLSTTSFNTSSDYRLKENVQPMTGALATVTALKPVTFNWKLDGSDGQGFIAHELQTVVPDCVAGEKDAVEMQQYEISPAVPATLDEEGNELTAAVEAVMGEREVPKYQGIDTSFLVATLTAAIQEQQAIITALTTRITALEAK